MGAKKLRVFAQIINLVSELSEDQKLDLLDVLRGNPQRASKPKAAKAAKEEKPKETKPKMCPICHNEETHFDHSPESPNYHIFRTDVKKKVANQ